MPHFWINDAGGTWGIHQLAGGCRLAWSGGAGARLRPPAGGAGPGDIRILPTAAPGGSGSWTLLAARDAAIRVNGMPLALGIRVLRDRDEVSFRGRRWYFSTEELARVGPFPGLAQPACCPRCKQRLEIGDAAVSCPHCHAWHHESEKFPCWTYDATCALCQRQSTALDAGYSWTPEAL